MAYNLKGFVQFTKSIANTSNTISKFGELSTDTSTYSINKKIYVDNIPSYYSLTTFISKLNTLEGEVPTSIRNLIYNITDWIIELQSSNNRYENREGLIIALSNKYSSNISNIDLGNLDYDETNKLLPTWISYTQLNLLDFGLTENNIKIWYSNNSFINEYDECDIVVIPPVANLDNFFGDKYTVENRIASYIKSGDYIRNLSSCRGIQPESSISVETLLWSDPNDPTKTIETQWVLIVYGKINDKEDYAKKSIKEYLKNNSNRTVIEWNNIFIELSKSTLFYILPRWNNYSITEKTLQVGIHNPIINLNKELSYVKLLNIPVTNKHIEDNLYSLPIQYRSMNLLAISGMDNRNNLFNISTILHDLINIPTSDIQYSVMSTNTQSWIFNITKSLHLAETITNTTILPDGYRKVFVNSLLFISFKLDNINYLVLSKKTSPNYSPKTIPIFDLLNEYNLSYLTPKYEDIPITSDLVNLYTSIVNG